ncbi:LysR family transcriptional regulator [Azoarcus sp. KH32C]|uniref:LysR family transcriptional regulator n=1 Tax=Azoarcus sp. KH32C TaxID=748247 RepID=UPI0002386B81|nr:LysR family transcriptional regulator [Azoarcus sp. KH32C]BAL24887.1 transcriptional regulator, LysR family [Azoarcus sp. KH32C]
MDQFQALRVFARVVEAGTFTKAADSLGMPKPTVTKLIQSLESHLRVKLLNRTTRRVTVTADGAAYYERTARLLTELEEIDASLSNAQASPKGRVRIDVPAVLASRIILPALHTFHARYPDIQIDMGVGDRLVNLIADNVDCVVRGGNIIDESLVARRISQVEFMTCATPGYLATYGVPTHPSELDGPHRVVGYFSAGTGRISPFEFERDGERIEIVGNYGVAVNDSNAYLAAGLAGLGIIQSGASVLQEHVKTGELVPVLEDWTTPGLPIYVVYPPNRHLSAKTRVFVDWIAELFGPSNVRRR